MPERPTTGDSSDVVAATGGEGGIKISINKLYEDLDDVWDCFMSILDTCSLKQQATYNIISKTLGQLDESRDNFYKDFKKIKSAVKMNISMSRECHKMYLSIRSDLDASLQQPYYFYNIVRFYAWWSRFLDLNYDYSFRGPRSFGEICEWLEWQTELLQTVRDWEQRGLADINGGPVKEFDDNYRQNIRRITVAWRSNILSGPGDKPTLLNIEDYGYSGFCANEHNLDRHLWETILDEADRNNQWEEIDENVKWNLGRFALARDSKLRNEYSNLWKLVDRSRNVPDITGLRNIPPALEEEFESIKDLRKDHDVEMNNVDKILMIQTKNMKAKYKNSAGERYHDCATNTPERRAVTLAGLKQNLKEELTRRRRALERLRYQGVNLHDEYVEGYRGHDEYGVDSDKTDWQHHFLIDDPILLS